VNIIRALIVDDEELARQIVREMLLAHPEVEVVAECANGFEAVKALAELTPDLLFLDVQMPKLDGFEVLELAGPDVAVIFLTTGEYNLATVYIVGRADVGEYGIAIVYSTVLIVVMMAVLLGVQALVGERRLGRRTAGSDLATVSP